MRSVAISEFKATCLALIEEVRATGETLVITRRGVPIARVEPPSPTSEQPAKRRLGGMRGRFAYHGDIVAPVVDPGEWEALR